MRHFMSTPLHRTPAAAGTPRTWLCALGLAASLAMAGPAQAADASATLQVTAVQVSASSGLQLNWLAGSAYQTLFAESREAGGLGGNSLAEPEPGFTWANQSVSTSTAHAAAAAQAGATGLVQLQADASRVFFDAVALPHTGAARVQQAGEFTLSGAGQVTILINYQLNASAVLQDGGLTFAQSTLSLSAGNVQSGVGSSLQQAVWSMDEPGGVGSRSGQLSLVIDLAGPQETGYYDLRGNLDVAAVAAVPEPANWAMLGSGLLALVGLARRRTHPA